MSIWCNVCQTRRDPSEADTDHTGAATCPGCGTRLNTPNGYRAD